ncbi:Mbov_0398 family ICE element protein [Mesomycoplasma molare]|uniref:ICEF Integrative Conjugal Element-II n=1 Tax=Mesomycoplasma molare TaxID=171288 RepID=A0ABY5TUZ9_9BACT|nr:hypothetical protein [Mesomycoplasma molare]UWD34482.1 hypothetical protein NX772_01470 [Mesomycoplasma molare]
MGANKENKKQQQKKIRDKNILQPRYSGRFNRKEDAVLFNQLKEELRLKNIPVSDFVNKAILDKYKNLKAKAQVRDVKDDLFYALKKALWTNDKPIHNKINELQQITTFEIGILNKKLNWIIQVLFNMADIKDERHNYNKPNSLWLQEPLDFIEERDRYIKKVHANREKTLLEEIKDRERFEKFKEFWLDDLEKYDEEEEFKE